MIRLGLVLMCLAGPAAPADLERAAQRESLGGLTGILSPSVLGAPFGLAERIKTTIELRLRQAGIKVEGADSTGKAQNRSGHWALLKLSVQETEVRSYWVSLAAYQGATTVTRPGNVLVLATWERGLLLYEPEFSSDDVVKAVLVAAASDLADQLANDYLAANPPRRDSAK